MCVKLDEFRLPGSLENVETGEADGERKSSRPGAAGIDVKNILAPPVLGFVGVAADEDLEARGTQIKVNIFTIVQHINVGSRQFDLLSSRKRLTPRLGIDVAANRVDRRDAPQLIENSTFPNVACVDDNPAAL